MVSQVFNLLLTSWNAVYGWFVSLTDAMGAWVYVSAVFFVMIVVRFILAPALQSGVSDGISMSRELQSEYKAGSFKSVTFIDDGSGRYNGGRWGS